MKPILAIDLDGALLYPRPFLTAHKEWFKVFSLLLDDESISEYANQEKYFEKVDIVMDSYLEGVNREEKTAFARQMYAMVTAAEVTQNDLVIEFAEFLRSIKNKFQLALITTMPGDGVDPILQKVECEDLFDIVYKSDMHTQPTKKVLFEKLIQEHAKPLFYIGDGDKHITLAKELGITTISVTWAKKGTVKGDFDVKTVGELPAILEKKDEF